jgi:hypothetical protein
MPETVRVERRLFDGMADRILKCSLDRRKARPRQYFLRAAREFRGEAAANGEYDTSSGFQPAPPEHYTEWFRPVAANVAVVLAPHPGLPGQVVHCARINATRKVGRRSSHPTHGGSQRRRILSLSTTTIDFGNSGCAIGAGLRRKLRSAIAPSGSGTSPTRILSGPFRLSTY